MADDLDAMLQGADQPPASPAQTTEGQQDDATQQTPEEVEFNSLTGSTQDRIKKLIRRAQDAEAKSVSGETRVVPPPPANFQNPETKVALEQLANAGVTTDEKLESKLNERENRLLWNFEMNRLESKYDGSKGEPKFVRDEVEDFMRTHQNLVAYAPEDVFRFKMFNDEFSNLERQTTSPKTGQTSTLRPSKANVQDEAMSPERIEETLQNPNMTLEQKQQWYDANLDKINAALERMVPPGQ